MEVPGWLSLLLMLGGIIGLVWLIIRFVNGIDPLDVE